MKGVDIISFEVIRSSTIYIAEEMGIALRNTAYSPNIRDRMDHSCAILSEKGELIAQAEHIPVHLGSMAVGVMNTIKYLEEEGIELFDKDVIIVNDPYIAGTHLNDILLLRPIFYNHKLIGYVANKAHHVDVGGSVPGSISGDAIEIFQEGMIIPPCKIIKKGRLNEEIIKLIISNVRVPRYTKGDLKAQIAALNVGIKRINELIEKYGLKHVIEAWKWAMDHSEAYIRNKIRKAPRGEYRAVDYLEGPNSLLNINASIKLSTDIIEVDYSGTHKQVDAPLNAVYGVTVAATAFALKAVLDPDMPMNHGFFRTVKINAPVGTLVNPKKPAPVAAGNLETSQRIVDVVLKALSEAFPEKVPAASHGSMNNIMIGGVFNNSTWAFYETVGGGMGARPTKDGVDGVHTNMTNTMNTPIEVIERECPILFLEYSLRKDTGGPGKYRGGLGIRRVFKLLKGRAILSIAAERIKLRPWGILGGMDGESGSYRIVKNSGEIIELSGKDTIHLEEGDIVEINTPGGGGYGNPKERDPELVIKDVLDEKISPESARKHYGIKV